MTTVAGPTTGITVSRQAGALGAIVEGADLSTDVDPAVFTLLHDALLEHSVICIRGQSHITPDDQVAFSARWGRIEPHPYVPPIEGHPEIMKVYDPNPITVTWHADFTYAKQPPGISLLLARVIPPYGGDTMFSSAYLAYENLSPGMRDRAGDRERHARGRDRQLPPGRPHPSGDRPPRVVRERQLHPPLRRMVRGGQPALARPPLRAIRPVRVHVAPPLAGG
jgi:alpha-ketoglutarate-dependent taurine dioxygenase